MFYNVTLIGFQDKECEIRLFEKGHENEVFRCDDFGVIRERKDKWLEDMWCPFVDDYEEDEIVDDMVFVHDIDEVEKRRQESIRCSLSRTKTKVYQMCRGYDWEWFLTFTFDLQKVDRYDYQAVSKCMSDWLWSMRKSHKRRGLELMYMIVPEQHKDGAWHFHGIFRNVDSAVMGLSLSKVEDVYNVTRFDWGFTTATEIRDPLAVSNYVSKYITKDLVTVTKGRRRYWATKNLSDPKRINIAMMSMRNMGRVEALKAALGDKVQHVSRTETPEGSVTYLQVAGSIKNVLQTLRTLEEYIDEIQIAN